MKGRKRAFKKTFLMRNVTNILWCVGKRKLNYG